MHIEEGWNEKNVRGERKRNPKAKVAADRGGPAIASIKTKICACVHVRDRRDDRDRESCRRIVVVTFGVLRAIHARQSSEK